MCLWLYKFITFLIASNFVSNEFIIKDLVHNTYIIKWNMHQIFLHLEFGSAKLNISEVLWHLKQKTCMYVDLIDTSYKQMATIIKNDDERNDGQSPIKDVR